MSVKFIASIGFAAHAFLGNFCTMPMAYAQDMSMPNEAHREASMEMTMTPMVPMSPVHCEHCVKVQHPDPMPMEGGMPCGNGHCLTHARSSTSAAAPSSNFFASAALPALRAALPVAPLELHNQPPATAPPSVSTFADTIVIRC